MNSFESLSNNDGNEMMVGPIEQPDMESTQDSLPVDPQPGETIINQEIEKISPEIYQDRGAKTYNSYENAKPVQFREIDESYEEASSESTYRKLKDKLRDNSGKIDFGSPEKAKKVIATAAAAVLVLGVGISATIAISNSNKTPTPTKPTQRNEQLANAEVKERIGIYNGYGEKGMYLSKNKTSEHAFASAVEVAEVCNDDECEMIKYVADNQVESMASYMALFPERLQPEGFKGLTISETEAKLESLSDDEYEEVQKQFNDVIDQAFTRDEVANGKFANVYMDKKDADGEVDFQNMGAVKCYTNESNVYKTLYWTEDGNGNSAEIGKMMVKITNNNNDKVTGICTQPITEVDNPVIRDVPEIPDEPTTTPDETTTTPDETTTTTTETTTQWGKSGDPHGGPDVTRSDKVNPDSEVSKEQNDNTNKGNQGNSQTNPGSGSGNTNPERKPGGENQGGSSTNGTNAYQDEQKIEDGKRQDDAGNAAQAAAQSSGGENGQGASAGGNNYSDSAEEGAVVNGDF